MYSGAFEIPTDDVASRISQNLFMIHAMAVIGTVGGIMYIISIIDDLNHGSKMMVYHLNMITLYALYIALAVDVVYQLIDSNHICYEKYVYTDRNGTQNEIECSNITWGLLIGSLILACFIPLIKKAMDCVYRYASSFQTEELRDDGEDEERKGLNEHKDDKDEWVN